MTDKTRTLASLISAGVLATSLALPAAAADNGAGKTSDAANGDQVPAADTRIPDTKVKSFAAAAQEVQAVAKEYRPKIKAAKQDGNNKQARQHAAQARTEMKQIIRDQKGISVKEYREITQQARKDKDLSKRIRSEMDTGTSKDGRADS